MKLKLVLVLVLGAAMASTALVATAQQSSDVLTIDRRGSETRIVTKNDYVPRAQDANARNIPSVPYQHLNDRGVYNVVWEALGEDQGLAHRAEELAQQLGTAGSDSDREKIKGQLTEVLEKQFDQRQKRHGEEIKQLEEQIKKLKGLVDKRQENRREIIGARLNQIVRESQGLGW